jgi:hypothetical protein
LVFSSTHTLAVLDIARDPRHMPLLSRLNIGRDENERQVCHFSLRFYLPTMADKCATVDSLSPPPCAHASGSCRVYADVNGVRPAQ